MRRGFCFITASAEKPSLSSAPGRKFSVRTSEVLISFETISLPCACARSIARLFLLRLNTGKKPEPAASSRRVLSPASGSILMTSAPRSASTSPHAGPITMCANSTTRTPSSGSTKSFGQAGNRGVAVERLLGNAFDEQRARVEKLVEVDAGRHAHAFEHEHEVLGDHVAARAGREGAAAEAAHGAVEVAHTDLVGGEGIGDSKAARVVEMGAFELFADLFLYKRVNPLHLGGISVSDGI